MTIFEAIGGDEVIQEAVARFYGRLLADPEVSSFFEDVDMVTLQRHMRAFITALSGGPDRYTGPSLVTAHAGLGISDTDFDAFLAHMVDTMISLGADDETIGRVGALIAPLRSQIVSAHTGHHVARPIKKLRADNPA